MAVETFPVEETVVHGGVTSAEAPHRDDIFMSPTNYDVSDETPIQRIITTRRTAINVTIPVRHSRAFPLFIQRVSIWPNECEVCR